MATPSSSVLSVVTVTSREQAMELYRQIELEEEAVGVELDRLLEQQSLMDLQISSFKQIIPNLHALHTGSQDLSSNITKASELADSISSKVRILDVAKGNVYAALKRVDDVIDLKNCVNGVEQAMTSGNYEQAAGHIRRYLDLDQTVLLESAVDLPRGATVSSSFALLKEAEVGLRAIIRDKIKKATDDKDKQSMERFVKIFPLLNLHEEGINYLANYLNTEIKEFAIEKLEQAPHNTGNRAGLVYADTLMSVYEEIAQKLDVYLVMIESCYDSSWISTFIKKLQTECDRQVEVILNNMSEERMLEHKTQTIAIALNSRQTAGAIRPDPLELDTLLTELSLCSSRTELYFKFVTKKVSSFDVTDSSIIEILKKSNTSIKIQEIIGWYIMIENYFMRESLSKAISVDHCEVGEVISSLPDDAFFVFQKSLKRAFASYNTDGACAMINNTSTLLLKEFKEELERSLKEMSSNNTYAGGLDLTDIPSMFQTSTIRTSSPKGDTWRTIGVACSNIEVSCTNLKKLIKQLQNEITLLVNDVGEIGKAKLDSCLAELCSASGVFQEMRHDAIAYFIEILMLPDIKQATEQFSTVSHIIEEDVLMNDEFIQKMVSTLFQSIDEAKAHLLPELFEDLMLQLVTVLSDILEQQVFKSNFNQLGGVKLDRDLRQLISFLSTKTQHPIRDKFVRIMQIASIVSLEKVVEVVEYCSLNSGPARWHLTNKEIKQILYLRKDFRDDEIENLKLS